MRPTDGGDGSEGRLVNRRRFALEGRAHRADRLGQVDKGRGAGECSMRSSRDESGVGKIAVAAIDSLKGHDGEEFGGGCPAHRWCHTVGEGRAGLPGNRGWQEATTNLGATGAG
jgi:hypothetical protein